MQLEQLKDVLFIKRKTYKDCAKVLDMSIPTFSNKVNGKSEFKMNEVIKLTDFLDLTLEEKENIFF